MFSTFSLSEGRLVHRIDDHRLLVFIHQLAMQLPSGGQERRYPAYRFNGPLPMSVERRHVVEIRRLSYFFTPKADGIRTMLILFRYYLEDAWQKMSVMLHRDGSAYLIVLEACDEAYERGGSVFDAELVTLHSQRHSLLLFDCYAYRGETQRHLVLSQRLQRINEFVKSNACTSKRVVNIMAKEFRRFDAENAFFARAIVEGLPTTLEYDVDGLVLVPSGPLLTATRSTSVQYKLKGVHTVDLILVEMDDDSSDEGADPTGQSLYLASLDESDGTFVARQQVTRAEMAKLGATLNDIVECTVAPGEPPVFSPCKMRRDKKMPNADRVVESTLRTIDDRVAIDELLPMDCSHPRRVNVASSQVFAGFGDSDESDADGVT